MSELMNARDDRVTMRWNLLAGVSALVLVAHISSVEAARAEEGDRPTVWIELGGQMEAMQGTSTPFVAPFMSTVPQYDAYKPSFFISDQRPPHHSFGLEGKIDIQPQGSDWTFSVSARYGRSHSKKHVHYQTRGQKTRGGGYYTSGGELLPLPTVPPGTYRHAEVFSDLRAPSSEQHLILDFTAGKDVGIGLFGRDGASNIDVGVRAVEFSQSQRTTIYARPALDFVNKKYFPIYLPAAEFNQYNLTGSSQRSFRGVGPSLAWNASAGLAGNIQQGELIFDWGINASLLFGKQKAHVEHGTQAQRYIQSKYFVGYTDLYPSRHNHSTRSRSVMVPNIGGFAALSVKYPNVKVALGYRADFFFGAVDAGNDERRTKTLGFQGPFASLSIGLGG